MEISEKEGTEEIFEPIRPENFHRLMLETQPQTDEAQKTPRTINVKTKQKSQQCKSYPNFRKSKIKKHLQKPCKQEKQGMKHLK